MSLILQALHWGSKLHQEELHLAELGISTLSALFVNANRDPSKGKAAEATDFHYFKSREYAIASETADAFFSLAKDGVIPDWVMGLAPIDKLREAKGDGTYSKPRAWIGDGVMLVCPRVRGDVVECQVAIVEHEGGVVDLKDPDSGKHWAIELAEGEARWVLDAKFDLIKSRLIL